MHAAGSTIVGNGEIYNYLELAEEFGLQDRWQTGSDFEPLLHIYALEGPKAFERLRGMYAFCLIGADGRTWLVRDRFGIKPLYVRDDGDGVAFASEIDALEHPRSPADLAPARELLALNYVLADRPLTTATRRLPPGSVHQVRDGRLHRHAVEPALPAPATRPSPGEADALLDRLDAVLEDSVRVHQRSDAPYGLFLSGGVNSTVIATLMARLNERPVVAFTCGWETTSTHDERRSAETVARALDLDWRETVFTAEDFWRIAPEIAAALDDPTSDFACLPTYTLAEAAKGALTVVLSGEGGDELFAGYGRYRRALRPRWLGGRPAEPQVSAGALYDQGASALAAWRQIATPAAQGRAPLSAAQAADVATWLPDDLLVKLDRCLMAHGLEGRTPFLDREVAAFAMALPDRMKVRGRYGKWLLRAWLERWCPAAEPWARKMGFTVPVADFIAPRAAELGSTVAANGGIRAVCDLDQVRAVFADPWRAGERWPLLFFALWWAIHVEGATAKEAAASLWS